MKYEAFISYKHAKLDGWVAKRIHRSLEGKRIPEHVREASGKNKLQRLFLDQEELPIGASLSDEINAALAESEFLIVICTPRTPSSEWVEKEIETFIQLHDRSHVLAVLAEGEPEDSFPKALTQDENGNKIEPLAADVRGRNKTERRKKIKAASLRLAAPLMGCSYDDLRQREREQALKHALRVALGVMVLLCAFSAYAISNSHRIEENYTEKQINQSRYLASTSLDLLAAGKRREAVLVAVSALPSKDDDRPLVDEAVLALQQCLYVYDMGTDFVCDKTVSCDSTILSMDYDETNTKLVVLDDRLNEYQFSLEDGQLLSAKPVELSGVEIPNASAYIGANVYISKKSLDNDLVVISSDRPFDAVDFGNEETKEAYIQLFDEAGAEVWCSTIEFTGNDLIYGNFVVNLAKGENGANRVAVGVNRTLYLFDIETGSLVGERVFTNRVSDIRLSATTPYLLLSCGNEIRQISLVDDYDEPLISVSEPIEQFVMRGGVLSIRSQGTNDITIYKMWDQNKDHIINSFERMILDVAISADGKMYAVGYGMNEGFAYDVFDENDQLIGGFSTDNASILDSIFYGQKLTVLASTGIVFTYDLSSGDLYTFDVSSTGIQRVMKVSDGYELLIEANGCKYLYDARTGKNTKLDDDEARALDEYVCSVPLDKIDGAKAYNPATNELYMSHNKSLYRFKYKSYQELIEEAARQFPGDELTREERTKYNVD